MISKTIIIRCDSEYKTEYVFFLTGDYVFRKIPSPEKPERKKD